MLHDLMLHKDYENFAENYLGIDYDDYVELLGEFELSEGELEFEYEMSF